MQCDDLNYSRSMATNTVNVCRKIVNSDYYINSASNVAAKRTE